MSDLLNSASLVMVPSGYKEDTVYSVVPSDGSGDLSFTRASNGTRINSAGLVEVCPWNLATNSENYTLWTLANVTVTANDITAPNGTLTADKLTISSNGNDVKQTISVMPNSVYTWTFYVYGGTATGQQGRFYDNTNATNIEYYNYSSSVVLGAWVKIERTFTTPSGCYEIQAWVLAATSTIGTMWVWGAQLNIGATAKPYFPTTDRLNVPRLTYQNGGGGCPSLLLEKQSTNLVIYSDVLQGSSQWGYSNEMTITEVSDTNPMGVSGCLKFTTTSANADHRAGQTSYAGSGYVSGDVICATAFVKANGYNFVKFGGNFGNEFAWYNLSNGTVSSQQSNVLSAKIENFGNGWYRITNVYTFQNTIGNGLLYFNLTPAPTADSVYTGNGTSGCFAFGGQVEKNSSYPTSYIQTQASSATRVADACFKTGISSLIGQTEGVIFYDGVLTGITNLYANLINSEKNVTGSFAIGQTITGSILAQLFVNGSSVIAFDAGSYALGTRTKIAFAYKSGSFALYANGTQLGTSAATFTPVENMDDIYIGDVTTYFNYKENTQVNQVALFKTRLSNSELASLTTI